jgi:nucleoside-diphosphate-sugar epimerase
VPELPDNIQDEPQLEELLSRPSDHAVAAMKAMRGDLIILGVGGKMGPTLARMARRASDAAGARRRVIGVARFSDSRLPAQLAAQGVEPLRADLLDEHAVELLPDCPNVLFMAGMKFGATAAPAQTWAMNTIVPMLAARRYAGSRFVAFSSGNVYGMTDADGTGSREGDALRPVGEYANSVLGRERVLEFHAQRMNTPTALLRLNYAVEMRYGVLADLARWVWQGRAIDVSMGRVNVIWQGDANAMALAAFDHAAVPAAPINIAGPHIARIADLARRLGALMNKPVRMTGQEAPTALLNDGSAGRALLGDIRVDLDRLLRWTADWTLRGGASLDKPTHFENRAGDY